MAGQLALRRQPEANRPTATQVEPRSRQLRRLRQLSQGLFLLLWLATFLLTRQQWQPQRLWPDLFLATDPLVAAVTLGASRVVVPSMAAALVLVGVTLAFGRVFCGWVCPLGTLIDGAAKLLQPRPDTISPAAHRRMLRWKYYVLAGLVVASLLSAQWVLLLDPMVLLFRAVATGVYPAITAPWPSSWQRSTLGMTWHDVAIVPVGLLLSLLLLTAISRRFYCRYLCPLGALFGLLSRAPLLRRRSVGCDGCRSADMDRRCAAGCRMAAVDAKPTKTLNHECIRCFSDRDQCPTNAVRFTWQWPGPPKKADIPLRLDRRAFLTWVGGSAAVGPMLSLSSFGRAGSHGLLRPPRVLDEATFLDQCVRCGMCVQACPTQTLQLTQLEAGIAGLWSPALTPHLGGCKASCNACGSACPTGAIPYFSSAEADKWAVKMGTAVLHKGLCISFGETKACGKCIDACPTKAIIIEPQTRHTPRRPHAIDYSRCVGCGLCEHACDKIVFGEPAIRVNNHGRGLPTELWQHPTSSMPR